MGNSVFVANSILPLTARQLLAVRGSGPQILTYADRHQTGRPVDTLLVCSSRPTALPRSGTTRTPRPALIATFT